jgi:hypothetical protein
MTSDDVQVLQINLRLPDGRTEQIIVDADAITIGSGAHCEIRLPSEYAAIEHVRLSLVGGAVYAQARSLDPHPTIDGVGFVRTPVLADSVLGVGPVQIRATSVGLTDPMEVVRKRASKVSPLTYVLAAVGLPIGAIMVMTGSTADSPPRPPTAPAALWGPPSATCPQTGRDAALAVAMEKLSVAEAKRERRPFHVEDGVAAVPLFELAAACFELAEQTGAAAEAARAAEELRGKINEDYRLHQVRLEHAMTVQDWVTAQKEVKVLLAFTEGQQAPYVVWLSNLDRRIMLKLARKEGSS